MLGSRIVASAMIASTVAACAGVGVEPTADSFDVYCEVFPRIVEADDRGDTETIIELADDVEAGLPAEIEPDSFDATIAGAVSDARAGQVDDLVTIASANCLD